ncbi:MAG: hypothetical protein AAF583_05455 [Pseudomonadota bacterium]
MTNLANISFNGDHAIELESSFEFLRANSPTFSRDFDNFLNTIGDQELFITSDNVLNVEGPGADAGGYYNFVDGTHYVRVNFEKINLMETIHADRAWETLDGQFTGEEIRFLVESGTNEIHDFIPLDPDYFYSRVDGIVRSDYEGSQDWAYIVSGAKDLGLSIDEFVGNTTGINYWSWIESQDGLDAFVSFRSEFTAFRELSLEETLAHEIYHGIIDGALITEENRVVNATNKVGVELGLTEGNEQNPNGTQPLGRFTRDLLDGMVRPPTALEVLLNSEGGCFLAGTSISMWDGTMKPIDEIAPHDLIVSYDRSGNLVPGRVTRTMENSARYILDVFGLMVTPGHVTLCGDGRFAGRHVPIIDILRSDGALVKEDGRLIRAATNEPVGSLGDRMVKAFTGKQRLDGSVELLEEGELRLGTRVMKPDGKHYSLLAIFKQNGWELTEDGYLFSPKTGELSPFYWSHSEHLPKPEDYVLQRSMLTLNDIYAAGEWEALPPLMAAPKAQEAIGRHGPDALIADAGGMRSN